MNNEPNAERHIELAALMWTRARNARAEREELIELHDELGKEVARIERRLAKLHGEQAALLEGVRELHDRGQALRRLYLHHVRKATALHRAERQAEAERTGRVRIMESHETVNSRIAAARDGHVSRAMQSAAAELRNMLDTMESNK